MIEREVMSRDGFVASFMGDGAMIVFGLPEPRPDDASRALLTVVGLYDSTIKWLETLPVSKRSARCPVQRGRYGTAVVSRLGPKRHERICRYRRHHERRKPAPGSGETATMQRHRQRGSPGRGRSAGIRARGRSGNGNRGPDSGPSTTDARSNDNADFALLKSKAALILRPWARSEPDGCHRRGRTMSNCSNSKSAEFVEI